MQNIADAARRLAVTRLHSSLRWRWHRPAHRRQNNWDADPTEGQHIFEQPEASAIIENALLHFDGERYRLLAWCVMSNHVHVVAQQLEGWPLAKVVHSWKSFTANEVNRLLGRNGPLWQREYFDRFMRDDGHLGATIAYVENNPVAAGLVERPQDWRWSSARLRFGQV